jgi:putative transposase
MRISVWRALEAALRIGRPDIFETDQGAQFTSKAFTGLLDQHGIKISMEGREVTGITCLLRGYGEQ